MLAWEICHIWHDERDFFCFFCSEETAAAAEQTPPYDVPLAMLNYCTYTRTEQPQSAMAGCCGEAPAAIGSSLRGGSDGPKQRAVSPDLQHIVTFMMCVFPNTHQSPNSQVSIGPQIFLQVAPATTSILVGDVPLIHTRTQLAHAGISVQFFFEEGSTANLWNFVLQCTYVRVC